MEEAIKDYTPAGKIKRPSYSLVATWVKEAWDDIDPAMIKRSFKCCGVSTKIDGSEDDSIFDFEKVSGKNDVGIGGGDIEEEGENDEESSDSDSDPNGDHYENDGNNYVNMWE